MSLEGQFIQAKPLLPRGLSPTQVADKFFESIDKRDVDLLLATLVFNAKRGPSAPGGFSWAEWIDGREKSRKYQAKYSFMTEERPNSEIFNPSVERYLVYSSTYGPVPGYAEGEQTVDSPIVVHLLLDAGEWRVKDANIVGHPGFTAKRAPPKT